MVTIPELETLTVVVMIVVKWSWGLRMVEAKSKIGCGSAR